MNPIVEEIKTELVWVRGELIHPTEKLDETMIDLGRHCVSVLVPAGDCNYTTDLLLEQRYAHKYTWQLCRIIAQRDKYREEVELLKEQIAKMQEAGG